MRNCRPACRLIWLTKFMAKACQRLEEAVRLYGQLVFADDLGQARTLSGYVAISEEPWHTSRPTLLGDSRPSWRPSRMAALPRDFIFLYEGVARQFDPGTGICQQMIASTKELIEAEQEPTSARKQSRLLCLASWYRAGINLE